MTNGLQQYTKQDYRLTLLADGHRQLSLHHL